MNNKPGAKNAAITKPFTFFTIVLVGSIPFYALNWLRLPTPLGLPPSFLMIIVPMLAAFYLAYRGGGTGSILHLVGRLSPSKGKRVWWFVAVAVIPTLMCSMYLVSWLSGNSNVTGYGLTGAAALTAFVLYFIGAIPEELGWTAYATGPLQRRYGVFMTGLIIGFIWEIWHLIPFLQQGRDMFSWIIPHMIASIGIRVIMGYIYAGTAAALLPALFVHALFNFIPEILPGGYADYKPAIFMPIVLLAVLLIAWKAHGSNSPTAQER